MSNVIPYVYMHHRACDVCGQVADCRCGGELGKVGGQYVCARCDSNRIEETRLIIEDIRKLTKCRS